MKGPISLALLFLVGALGVAQCKRLEEKQLNLLDTSTLGSSDYTPRHIAGYFKVQR